MGGLGSRGRRGSRRVDRADGPFVAVLDPAAPVDQVPLVVPGDDEIARSDHGPVPSDAVRADADRWRRADGGLGC